jgi:tetratricopeptide (TPR) repeat protein
MIAIIRIGRCRSSGAHSFWSATDMGGPIRNLVFAAILWLGAAAPAGAQAWREAALAQLRGGEEAYEQGRLFEASRLLGEAFDALKKRAPRSPEALTAASYLAGTYHLQERFEEEEALQRFVLDGRRAANPDSVHVMLAALAHAGALIELGRLAEARVAIDEAGRLGLILGAHPEALALVQVTEAKLLSVLGRYPEAITRFGEACGSFSPGSQPNAYCLREAALTFQAAGRGEEALGYITSACNAFGALRESNRLQGGAPLLFGCLMDQGYIELANGRAGEAHAQVMFLLGATANPDEFGAVITRGASVLALASEALGEYPRAYGEWQLAGVQRRFGACREGPGPDELDCNGSNPALILALAGEARLLTDRLGDHRRGYALALEANEGVWARYRQAMETTPDEQRRQQLIGNRENFLLEIRAGWRATHPD